MNRKIIQTALAALVVSFLLTAPRAQQTPAAAQAPEDRIALYQALLDLTNPWTVMCIAAHPDDEDGTSLIVMRRKYGAHTVSLFSTFGEGGQNAIGPELYEEMGAIRARETMAAAEIQGSEPHFLGLKDFGYSKSADEAFKFWGHDEALRRMVLEIRKLRPDVIITNHSVTNKDHGHHQATARLELEAFDAAADPKHFPEQLKDGVTVWQVQRLFVRARGNAQAPADNSPVVTIDPNEQDPVRGVVYGEEALRALQKHATQGPWPKTFAEFAARFRAFSGQSAGPGQLPLTRYRLTREAKGAEPLPKDSHNFLDGLRLPENVEKAIRPPTIDGRPLFEFNDQPARVFEALLGATKNRYGAVSNLVTYPDEHVFRMVLRIGEALATSGGVRMRFIHSQSVLVPNTVNSFTVELTNAGQRTVNVNRVSMPAENSGVNSATSRTLSPGTTMSVTSNIKMPLDAKVNLPQSAHLYDENPFGQLMTAGVYLNIDGAGALLKLSRQVDIGPSVEISSISPSALVITPQTANVPKTLTLQVINHEKSVLHTSIGALIAVDAPERKRTKINETPLTIGPGEKREVRITLPNESKKESMLIRRTTTITMTSGQPPVTTQEATPSAPAARLLFRTTDGRSNEVAVPFVGADARVAPNLRVGYVRGFDFSLPNALNALGVESKELSVDEVKTADLSKYTSIIVDNRVYESQPELIVANQKLLDYANAGGTLIVFYHKSNEWNPDERRKRPQLAPYKLILGDERITDETAPITFIEPDHPLLNFPNKMGQEDFANWIQERGLYYPKDWDAQYHALLQSNDPGEAPLKGGLLVADFGRGHYIYTSMVWYRELRGGVPGAYRMLANMISYGHSK
jgi:LmbE family N-acetylglucosaminyl deacetylase